MGEGKQAVLLHGTDGQPTDHWFPWLKKQFEQTGYDVFAPELPSNHTPSRQVYEKFLRESGFDFADCVLVGHSSGATTVLNLLSADWFPHVRAVVLVGTFLNERLTKSAEWYDPGQFDDLFLPEYNAEKIKQKADGFYFVHGSDDPYCDIKDAKTLCTEVGGQFIMIENGHHLGGSVGLTKLPQLTEALRADGLL